MTQPAITVVIVEYASGARLLKCLKHLRAQTFRDFTTLIVDNSPEDRDWAGCVASGPPFRLIRPGENLGFAAGNNLGVSEARTEWVALLNPDAYAAPDWLENLYAAALRNPSVAAFGSLQRAADDPERLDGAGDAYHASGIAYRGHFGWLRKDAPSAEDKETFAPCAAAALYRRDVWQSLGGFDERFFCYSEDVDYGFRVRLAGGRCLQANAAIVDHEGSGVSQRYSAFTVFHGARNRIWTFVKDMPSPLFWLLLPVHASVNLAVLARAVARRETLAPTWRGIVAALRGLGPIWASRKEVQGKNRANARDIAGILTWSPAKMMRREADLRPLSSGASPQPPAAPPAKPSVAPSDDSPTDPLRPLSRGEASP